MKTYVDANVFLRHLMEDHQKQAAQAAGLFADAEAGKLELVSGPPVLFEVAWSLRRGYGRSRVEVQESLEGIMALRGLEMNDAPVVLRALQLGRAHNMEFADAYIAASTLASKAELATFNERDFKDAGVALHAWGRA